MTLENNKIIARNAGNYLMGAGMNLVNAGYGTLLTTYECTIGRMKAHAQVKVMEFASQWSSFAGEGIQSASTLLDQQRVKTVEDAKQTLQHWAGVADCIREAVYSVPRMLAPKVTDKMRSREEGVVASFVTQTYKNVRSSLEQTAQKHADYQTMIQVAGNVGLTIGLGFGLVGARIADGALAVGGLALTILTSPLTLVEDNDIQQGLSKLHTFTYKSLSFTRIISDLPSVAMKLVDSSIELPY